ncbi:MAG: 2OG-Fe(II) oxygenase family protein [Alphaproteobacteria bacterium]
MAVVNSAVHELFRTPVWVVDLDPKVAAPLNRQIMAMLDEMTGERVAKRAGQTWQTRQDLHTTKPLKPLVDHLRSTVRGALTFLDVEYEDFNITGCWANINPPGAKHSSHTHPNNYLSGVYYVKADKGADEINFYDPRAQASAIMPKARKFNYFNGNVVTVETKPGRIVVFPAWLVHGVPQNRSTAERVSIAFNVMLTGFGDAMSKPMWEQSAVSEP